MRDLMLTVASIMPVEELVVKLQESASEARLNPTDENLKMLELNATMFLMNRSTKGDIKNVFSLIKEIDELDKMKAVFKVNSN